MDTIKSSAMKKAAVLVFMGVLIPITLFVSCGATAGPSQTRVHVHADFAILDNYGEWIEVAPFGWVWRPFVVAEWRPFFYGHWVWADAGWTWISYEPYGWLVYHYGNWQCDPVQGWIWIPGNVWSPARVSWISFGIYIGWAPLPPPHVVLVAPWEVQGARINVWNVVETRNFTREEVGRTIIAAPPRPRTEIEYRAVYRAPAVSVIERETHQPVERIKISSEMVRMGSHDYRRFTPPPKERERIEQHQAQVEREIIKPRAENKAPATRERKEASHEKTKHQKKNRN